jgi:SRSO17 transposase
MTRSEEVAFAPDAQRAGLQFRAGWEVRFEEFVAGFRTTFHRADQFLRFRAYLRGLIEPSDRKNVEAIAVAARRVIHTEANLGQALQHFVSHSPWDPGRLFAAVRRHAGAIGADPAAVWVVHDGTFVKKGRHSVGVQPQFARSLGRKVNCQVGVFVTRIGPAGYFPLAARLYLPAAWLRSQTVGTSVPEDVRSPASKAEIALRLLDEVRAETDPLPVTGEPGYLSDMVFREGAVGRGLVVRDDAPAPVAEALRRFEWLKGELGLDHFEGRTWHGWHHHVSLVFAAYGFVCGEAVGADAPPFRSAPPSRS